MITGELKSQVDKIWEAFWTGGISNPLTVIEQFTFLLFLRRIDELDVRRCFTDIKDVLNDRVQDVDYFISMGNMKKIMTFLSESKVAKYPRETLFRLDRQNR